jgi:hypothetical protein
MRKQFSKLLLLLLSIGLFTFSSCLPEFNFNEEELDNNWQPGFAIPILNTTLSLDDALDNFETGGFINIAADDLITVVYRGQTISLTGGQMFSLPNIPIPIIINPQTTPVPLPNGVEFDNITLKNGDLVYGASSLNLQPVNVTLTLQDLTTNGSALQVQFTVPASDGMSPATFQDTTSIAEHNLSFSNNEFTTQYTAEFSTGLPAVLVGAAIELNNLDYSYIDGYFGTRVLNTSPGSSVIDLFQNWQQGNIEFVDPKLRLTLNNSYGIPLSIRIDSFSAVTHFNGVQNFQNADLDNGVDLAHPTLGEVGEFSTTEILLDNTNSNIDALVSGVPYEFHYDFIADVNPDADPTIDNHITDTSSLSVDVDIELPMNGNIGLFTIKDTFQFDFSEYQDVDRMKLRLTTDNGFPFDVNTQIYFLDSTNVLIDSLFTDSDVLLAAANVDGNGNVTSSNVNVQERPFDIAAFAKLKDEGRKVVVVGSIETVNGGTTPVKILTSYEVTFQLGAIIGF